MCVSTAYRHLARIVWESLPSSVAEKIWTPPGPSRTHCTFRDALIQATIPAIHLELPYSLSLAYISPPMRIEGKSLLCCRPMTLTCVTSSHTAALVPSKKLRYFSLISSANVVLFLSEWWQRNPSNPSCSYPLPSLNIRLLFSSSLMALLNTRQIGGAGVVVLAVTPDAISMVSWHSFALNKCKDNIYAEAFGWRLYVLPMCTFNLHCNRDYPHPDVDMIQAHYELVRRLSQSQYLLPAWQMRSGFKTRGKNITFQNSPTLRSYGRHIS